MKKLFATLITLTSLAFSSNTYACPSLVTPAMNMFQSTLASFMVDKMDVLPGDIVEIKELERKTRNSLVNGVAYHGLTGAIAAITSPIWLPVLIADTLIPNTDLMYGGYSCPQPKNIFKAKFLVTYRSPSGQSCKVKVHYKAKGRILEQLRDENFVTKTIIKTKFAPVCE